MWHRFLLQFCQDVKIANNFMVISSFVVLHMQRFHSVVLQLVSFASTNSFVQADNYYADDFLNMSLLSVAADDVSFAAVDHMGDAKQLLLQPSTVFWKETRSKKKKKKI